MKNDNSVIASAVWQSPVDDLIVGRRVHRSLGNYACFALLVISEQAFHDGNE